MACLANNARMVDLAKKFDAELTFDFGSVVGEVEAPHPTPMSMWREVVADTHGFATAMLDVQTKLLQDGVISHAAKAGIQTLAKHGSSAFAGACGLRRRVTHRLDVVSVRIEHERAVVVRVVVRPRTRRTVVLAAGRHRGLVERVDRRAVLRGDRDVHRPLSPPSPPIQKSGLPSAPKPQAFASCSFCCTSMITT